MATFQLQDINAKELGERPTVAVRDARIKVSPSDDAKPPGFTGCAEKFQLN